MRKTLGRCSALLIGICLVVGCVQEVKRPNESARSGVEKVKALEDAFKQDLITAIESMSDDAKPLLSSVVFQGEQSSVITNKSGVFSSTEIFDDDEVFENLSDSDKAKVQEVAEEYFCNVQNVVKAIKVFDKGLPEGVEETDLFVKYAGIEYSKCVPGTLEMAYQIRDELYNPDKNLVKGARLWITPRWHLIGAPLGAIFYSYASNFTDDEKAAIRHAMDEWENATDGAVHFYERPLNWWGLVKWGLGITRNVRIEKVQDRPYSGKAMPGNMPWSYLRLNTNEVFTLKKDEGPSVWKGDASWTHKTLIHELGHVICLQHEFERSDRDAYVEAEETVFPGTCGFTRWLQKINIINYGSYDYKSCMNYDGKYRVKGTSRMVEFDDVNKISHNDALTVKYIYSKISYKEMMDNWQDTKSLMLEEV